MTYWIRNNWQWLLLNAFASFILLILLSKLGKMNYRDVINNLAFEQIGQWSIRFLVLSLAMSPIHMLLGWRIALNLRKPAGLWAFVFAGCHLLLFLSDRGIRFLWQKIVFQQYVLVGIGALIILTLLAATSFRRAQRLLGKNWKRLHRAVYLAAILAMLHGVLAATAGKQVLRDNVWLNYEMKIYVVLLGILLALRIPFIWSMIVSHRPKRKRKQKRLA